MSFFAERRKTTIALEQKERHRHPVTSAHSARAHLRPKKSLGQHFLRDPNIVRKILVAIAPGREDVVLEIGPGEGVLTRVLAPLVARLVAVEIDPRAVEFLRRDLGDRVTILEQDVLELNLGAIAGGKLRVVGNIPYNITSPILFSLLDQREVLRDATLMMQREVARRLVALPGTKDYGILSVFARIFTDSAVLFDVSPNAFVPAPAVISSLLQLRPLERPRVALKDERFFRQMVRSVFHQRRKMLRHTLQAFLARHGQRLPEAFALRERPEELTPEDLAVLGNRLLEALGGGGGFASEPEA
jgi:16S rRNA (adenine1518-N6/adenine1519-N6)-dimethyltransferase